MAIAFNGLVGSSRLIEVAEVSPEIRATAWEIFTTYRDQVLSFTDCTSFALMRERKLLEAFTFDADFQRAGFIVHPPSS